jgi:hypothetical protein
VSPLPTTPAGQREPIAPPVKKTSTPATDPLRISANGQLPLRQWRDDTGVFQIQARLILILDGKVRLLKETGRTTTVPMDRLSHEDRAYVEAVVERYGKDLTQLGKVAAR